MRLLLAVALLTVTASIASAQSAYVGASLIGDLVRTSGSSFGDGTGNGETFGGALRVGTPLGQQLGVELEFARSGKMEMTPGGVFPAGAEWSSLGSGDFPFTEITSRGLIFPSPRFESERRLATISTLLWWNHELSDRISLVYLGGVAFTRTSWKVRISYPDLPIPPLPFPRFPTFPPPDLTQESTAYGADVAVGFEGRVGMTEHVRLIPGIRLQTISAGWAIRPAIGLQWVF